MRGKSHRASSAPRRRTLAGLSAGLAAAFALALAACTVEIDVPGDALPRDAGVAGDAAAADTRPDAGGGAPDAAPASDTTDAAPGEDVRPPGDVPLPRDVPAPRDVPPDARPDGAGDAAGDAGPDPDTFTAPELPTVRYCPWDLGEVPLVQRSRLLAGEDFSAATALATPVDRACDTGLFPDRDRPERVWALLPDAPARLVVRAQCPGWDCEALLVADDCILSNVRACATGDGDPRVDEPLAPGLSLIQLEPRFGFEPGAFDLLVAINYTEGRDPCPVAGEIRLSQLAGLGECALDGAGPGGGVRTIVLEGDTAAPDARDDVFVDCRGAGIDRDSIGGAPDRIWRIVADSPDRTPRLIAAEVSAAEVSAAEVSAAEVSATDGAWEPVVAVTGAPCGAAEGVIDCDRGSAGTAAVSGVTIFYGEELYVVVDGVGERLLEGAAAGPFTLRLTIDDPTCAAPLPPAGR